MDRAASFILCKLCELGTRHRTKTINFIFTHEIQRAIPVNLRSDLLH